MNYLSVFGPWIFLWIFVGGSDQKEVSSSKYVVEILPVEKTYLGESPHWDAENQQLYYIDISPKVIHRYVPATGEDFKVAIDEKSEGTDSVGFVIPVANSSNKFLIGFGRSLALVNWDGKSSQAQNLKVLHVTDDGNRGGRFNDGKCDPYGRLWAGTMGSEPSPGDYEKNKGLLYKLDEEGELSRQLDKISIANGLAWSPDHKTFYYIDSLTYRIDAFDYDAQNGTISNRRPAFDFKKHNITGFPDGMTIDADGNLWVAVFFGKKILHINPRDGSLIDVIEMPCSNVTSVAFGGPNLDILFATSAQHGLKREELEKEPAAGSLFKITNTGARGLASGTPYSGKI